LIVQNYFFDLCPTKISDFSAKLIFPRIYRFEKSISKEKSLIKKRKWTTKNYLYIYTIPMRFWSATCWKLVFNQSSNMKLHQNFVAGGSHYSRIYEFLSSHTNTFQIVSSRFVIAVPNVVSFLILSYRTPTHHSFVLQMIIWRLEWRHPLALCISEQREQWHGYRLSVRAQYFDLKILSILWNALEIINNFMRKTALQGR